MHIFFQFLRSVFSDETKDRGRNKMSEEQEVLPADINDTFQSSKLFSFPFKHLKPNWARVERVWFYYCISARDFLNKILMDR